MTRFYLMVVGDIGIYEAVDRDCPRDDPRRVNKPDGSWLPKVGTQYHGAVSFWTDVGVKQYIDSGLLAWHASVVNGEISVLIAEMKDVLYSDVYQVIDHPDQIQVLEQKALDEFLNR